MVRNLMSILRDASIQTQPFGVTVARVWSARGSTTHPQLEEEQNPYRFGDLPTSWAESFRRCLEGALVAEDLKGLPDNAMLDSHRFFVRGAQYGSLHISKNVSLFIDGWYSEIEPKPGEQCFSCISIPTGLLFEVQDFFVKCNVYGALVTARRGTTPNKIIPFKSEKFPEISFIVSFRGDYPQVLLTPTLLEFEVEFDGTLLPPKFDGKSIAFGQISLPEAQTLQLFAAQLAAVPITDVSDACAYINYVLKNGVDDCQDFPSHCCAMVYVASDIISFVFPPEFLANAEPMQNVTPPVAISTHGLARFIRSIVLVEGGQCDSVCG